MRMIKRRACLKQYQRVVFCPMCMGVPFFILKHSRRHLFPTWAKIDNWQFGDFHCLLNKIEHYITMRCSLALKVKMNQKNYYSTVKFDNKINLKVFYEHNSC